MPCTSPDGKQVASGMSCHLEVLPTQFFDTGSNDRTAIMWSIESGEKVRDPLGYHTDWVCQQACFCFCY